MRRQNVLAEMAHDEVGGEEQQRLEQHGEADRQAQHVDLLQLRPVRRQRAYEDAVFVQLRRQAHDGQHRQEGEGERRRARDARSHESKSWRAEMAEDQRIVEQSVEEHRQRHHDQRRTRLGQSGRIIAQHLEAQAEGQAEAERHHEFARSLRQLGRLAEQDEDRLGAPQETHQRRRHHHHRPESHARDHAHVARVRRVGAQDMRDHRRHRRGRPASQDPAEIEQRVAQHGAGQRRGRESRQHGRVGHPDRHLRELGEDQRPGELQELAALGDPGVETMPRDPQAGMFEIEFGNIGHDTDLTF